MQADAAGQNSRVGDACALFLTLIQCGERPARFEQASKFWLVVNLKTARQLGITVPPNLLTLADEVMQCMSLLLAHFLRV